MKRGEYDWDAFDPPTANVGTAELREDDHSPHTYLYVPDLSSQTGWGSHAVPTKEPPRERRPVGFRRDRG